MSASCVMHGMSDAINGGDRRVTEWTYPIKVDHPLVHEDGIFVGLSESEYHQAFALSSSGIKNMKISSLDFWVGSSLNPAPEPRDTIALKTGRAYHKLIIEGRPAFDALFAPELDQNDYPDALRTNEQMIAALGDLGIKVPKSTRKAELIARLVDLDPAIQIWDTIKREHELSYPDREFLPRAVIRQIEIANAMIQNHPQLCKAFTGGLPEVSIFWHDQESGAPFKARLDYWKVLAVVDLKSIFNSSKLPLKRAFAIAIANYGYYIQTALYLRAAHIGRKFAAEGRIFGDYDKSFMKAMASQTDPFTFLFVLQSKGPAPVARGMVLGEGPVLDIARIEISEATRKFCECFMTYGSDPWVDIADIETFDHLAFPAYLGATA